MVWEHGTRKGTRSELSANNLQELGLLHETSFVVLRSTKFVHSSRRTEHDVNGANGSKGNVRSFGSQI
jgi:hypothetical protein